MEASAVPFLTQMDICSHIGLSTNAINSLSGMCLDPLGSTYGVVGDFSVDELAYKATKFLNIQDDEDGDSRSIPPHEKDVFQMKDECGEAHQSERITKDHKKTLSSAAASVGEMEDDLTSEVLTHDDNAKSINPPSSSDPSLPVAVRNVGWSQPPKKLSVKWAPDVYDPVPTLVVSTSNGGRKHSGKKKSKKKGSRESKGKEKKKQSRKRVSLNYYYSEQEEEAVFGSAIDFNLDLFCGSSFANPYGSSLHLSSITAEAT
ncbi:hypothetical protein OSB04_009658 [Centaurea solstitialis]|uniref:Uncharacterized protein n=1 Tax=Centaurea solstitialis TaxID=347529 RepID=A0AA38T620_9ASTR|nr:hypothetical protein OSB04_009658 [Centaurea solstitialis]